MKQFYEERLFENSFNNEFGLVGSHKATVILLRDFMLNKD